MPEGDLENHPLIFLLGDLTKHAPELRKLVEVEIDGVGKRKLPRFLSLLNDAVIAEKLRARSNPAAGADTKVSLEAVTEQVINMMTESLGADAMNLHLRDSLAKAAATNNIIELEIARLVQEARINGIKMSREEALKKMKENPDAVIQAFARHNGALQQKIQEVIRKKYHDELYIGDPGDGTRGTEDNWKKLKLRDDKQDRYNELAVDPDVVTEATRLLKEDLAERKTLGGLISDITLAHFGVLNNALRDKTLAVTEAQQADLTAILQEMAGDVDFGEMDLTNDNLQINLRLPTGATITFFIGSNKRKFKKVGY